MHREQLIEALHETFGDDRERINHAMRVLEFAERLNAEVGADAETVEAAAILHDIGIVEGERRFGSWAAEHQERFGPPMAEAILTRIGFDAEKTEHVKRIIANHHSARDIDTPEFRVIWDADWLVNLPGATDTTDRDGTARRIGKIFRTEPGRRIAQELYLS